MNKKYINQSQRTLSLIKSDRMQIIMKDVANYIVIIFYLNIFNYILTNKKLKVKLEYFLIVIYNVKPIRCKTDSNRNVG